MRAGETVHDCREAEEISQTVNEFVCHLYENVEDFDSLIKRHAPAHHTRDHPKRSRLEPLEQILPQLLALLKKDLFKPVLEHAADLAVHQSEMSGEFERIGLEKNFDGLVDGSFVHRFVVARQQLRLEVQRVKLRNPLRLFVVVITVVAVVVLSRCYCC